VICALVRQEEEGLVLPYRSTDGATELVLMEDRLLLANRKEVPGVHEGVTIEIEDTAVELVGSALDQNVHDAARIATILGIDRRGNQVEFLDGVRAGKESGRIQRDVIGVQSVDHIGALV